MCLGPFCQIYTLCQRQGQGFSFLEPYETYLEYSYSICLTIKSWWRRKASATNGKFYTVLLSFSIYSLTYLKTYIDQFIWVNHRWSSRGLKKHKVVVPNLQEKWSYIRWSHRLVCMKAWWKTHRNELNILMHLILKTQP